MRQEASTGRGGHGALPGSHLCLPGRLADAPQTPHRVDVYPLEAGQRFALRRAYHAVEAAVEAADAKDPTFPNAPVEAADEAVDEAADAEDRLPLPLAPVEAADAAHP